MPGMLVRVNEHNVNKNIILILACVIFFNSLRIHILYTSKETR